MASSPFCPISELANIILASVAPKKDAIASGLLATIMLSPAKTETAGNVYS